jgi:hypothetical protein
MALNSAVKFDSEIAQLTPAPKNARHRVNSLIFSLAIKIRAHAQDQPAFYRAQVNSPDKPTPIFPSLQNTSSN